MKKNLNILKLVSIGCFTSLLLFAFGNLQQAYAGNATCTNGATDCGNFGPYTVTASCTLHGFGGSGQSCVSYAATNGPGTNFMAQYQNGLFPNGEFTTPDGQYNVLVAAGTGTAQMQAPDDIGSMSIGTFSYSYSANPCNGGKSGASGVRSSVMGPGDFINLSITNSCTASYCTQTQYNAPQDEQLCDSDGGDPWTCHNNAFVTCNAWGGGSGSATLQATYCYTAANPASGGINYHPTGVPGQCAPDPGSTCSINTFISAYNGNNQSTLSWTKSNAQTVTITDQNGNSVPGITSNTASVVVTNTTGSDDIYTARCTSPSGTSGTPASATVLADSVTAAVTVNPASGGTSGTASITGTSGSVVKNKSVGVGSTVNISYTCATTENQGSLRCTPHNNGSNQTLGITDNQSFTETASNYLYPFKPENKFIAELQNFFAVPTTFADASDTVTATLNLNVLSCSASPSSPATNQSVTWTASGGSGSGYTWQQGNSTVGSGSTYTTSYSSVGAQTLNLTDSDGGQTSCSAQVNGPACTASTTPVVNSVQGLDSQGNVTPAVYTTGYAVLYGNNFGASPTVTGLPTGAAVSGTAQNVNNAGYDQINIALNNVFPGTYFITIKNSNGCAVTVTINIVRPPSGYSWQTGSWSTCSAGNQTRTVTCVDDNTGNTVPDSDCSGTPPSSSQSCTSPTTGCGSAAGQPTNTSPQSNLCNSGYTASSVSLDPVNSDYTWSCGDGNSADYSVCTAPYTGPINGQCGAAEQDQCFDSAPQSGLCYTGSPSPISGDGSDATPWTWTCQGVNGGTNASCSAYSNSSNTCTGPACQISAPSPVYGFSGANIPISWNGTCTVRITDPNGQLANNGGGNGFPNDNDYPASGTYSYGFGGIWALNDYYVNNFGFEVNSGVGTTVQVNAVDYDITVSPSSATVHPDDIASFTIKIPFGQTTDHFLYGNEQTHTVPSSFPGNLSSTAFSLSNSETSSYYNTYLYTETNPSSPNYGSTFFPSLHNPSSFSDPQGVGSFTNAALSSSNGYSSTWNVPIPANAIPGPYSYTVVASTPNGASRAFEVTFNVQAGTRPSGPASSSVNLDNTICKQITVNWGTVNGATGYNIYRSTSNSFSSATKIGSNVSGTSYIDKTVTVAQLYYYWVTAVVSGVESNPTAATNNPEATSNCVANLGDSDKDIIAINGNTVSPAPSQCNSVTDALPANTSLGVGSLLTFQINLCNDQGRATATSISVVDKMINLVQPTAGWGAQYCVGASCSSITPTVSGSAPNQTLTFNVPGNIPAGGGARITFSAQTALPSGFTGTSGRFQNSFTINYGGGTAAGHTPLIPFYSGKSFPTIKETP